MSTSEDRRGYRKLSAITVIKTNKIAVITIASESARFFRFMAMIKPLAAAGGISHLPKLRQPRLALG
jgi:hypothetical protein